MFKDLLLMIGDITRIKKQEARSETNVNSIFMYLASGILPLVK